MTDHDEAQEKAHNIKSRCEAKQHLVHKFTKRLITGTGGDVDPERVISTAQALAEAELQVLRQTADEAQEQIESLLQSAQSPNADEQDSKDAVIQFPYTTH